jgi:hypothetical protein
LAWDQRGRHPIRPRDRWGGWNGEEFTAAGTRHVSVYEAAA